MENSIKFQRHARLIDALLWNVIFQNIKWMNFVRKRIEFYEKMYDLMV